MSNKFNGYKISWTQPYNINFNTVYGRTPANTDSELKQIVMIDGWVDAMTRYPEAEKIIHQAQYGF